MPTFESGHVVEIVEEREGLQRIKVRMDDAGDTGEVESAFCLTDLVGTVDVGDPVVCNTTAVRLGLGTGGDHIVHWNLRRTGFSRPGPDHVMKLRYTSLQFDAGTSELSHPDIPTDLGGRPVVAFSVHSQLGILAAMLAHERPELKLAYVMTDGAALPAALSTLVHRLRLRGCLSSTVTAGHAFGGDMEAVTVASGLTLAAGVADADVIAVGMGPGVVGTGTPLGHTGLEAAGLLDTAAALGGRPVLCVRASSGDRRIRHQGLSHHSDTVMRLGCVRPHVAPVPDDLRRRHDVSCVEIDVPTIGEVVDALDAFDLRVTTMDRGPGDDELFFVAAAAAARVAALLHDDA